MTRTARGDSGGEAPPRRRPGAARRAAEPARARPHLESVPEPEPDLDDARDRRGGFTFGNLFRGSGSVLGQVTGIDGPTRSLERLAASAERAADFLDRVDSEIGLRRAANLADRLELVAELLEGRGPMARRVDHVIQLLEDTNRAVREIEAVVIELYERGPGGAGTSRGQAPRRATTRRG